MVRSPSALGRTGCLTPCVSSEGEAKKPSCRGVSWERTVRLGPDQVPHPWSGLLTNPVLLFPGISEIALSADISRTGKMKPVGSVKDQVHTA